MTNNPRQLLHGRSAVRGTRTEPDRRFSSLHGVRHRRVAYLVVGLAAMVVATSTALWAITMSGDERSPAGGPSGLQSPSLEGLPTGWTRLPDPPEVRSRAASVWTGDALLVWGGYVYTGLSDESPRSDGLAFDARSREWEPMSPSPLMRRLDPASAWTGEELLVWGGWDGRNQFYDDGAVYDPATTQWRSLPQAPISARAALSVWTGEEFIVWGTAVRVDERPHDGAAYNPRADSWRLIAESPIELTDATAVWTGREMIVFGAALHGGNMPESKTAIGAAYDPATDGWRILPDSTLSPQASTAAWTGHELVAWDYLNHSGAYSPTADRWRQLPDLPLDSGECVPRSVVVNEKVFGDYCGQATEYDPSRDRWRDVSRPEFAGWGLEVVDAGAVAIVLARNADTGENEMLAYRPSTG
jgi:Kelch motif